MDALTPPPYSTDPEQLAAESVVEYVRAGGPGGQHRNKRETGIRLVHPPSGVVVMATERRSRLRNTSLAFERLILRLEALNFVPEERVPTRIPRSVQRTRVANKRRTGERKVSRRTPASEDS